jgi:hypothetical protein
MSSFTEGLKQQSSKAGKQHKKTGRPFLPSGFAEIQLFIDY